KESDEEGIDAAIIGCFYDPGLETAREISENMVIVGPAESSMNIASTYGHKFSIIVGRKKWIPQMENNVVKYGYKDRLASFRSLGLGVLDFHEDTDNTSQIIKEEAKKAVEEDNAEVIILGCTRQFGFYKELQDEIGVPVIDTILAPFKYAELSADLKNRFGWKQSKVGGYESPPKEEIDLWNLSEEYL
ncbi:MAG: aspartate/glutamate racemase family protein, partial [Candidatus Saliniplasma sp.]